MLFFAVFLLGIVFYQIKSGLLLGRSGVIVTLERNPIAFWFFIAIWTAIGLASLAYGFYAFFGIFPKAVKSVDDWAEKRSNRFSRKKP